MKLIVPKVSGGVADFTDLLSRQLGLADGVIAVNKSCAGVLDQVRGHDVLLQYSGYGYAKRGAPLWLLRRLSSSAARPATLGVFFHELYAFGPPWSSAFWLSPLQRHIARELAAMADFWMTSCRVYESYLERSAGKKPRAVLPVFSNVGEAGAFRSRREPRVVVFGSAGTRRRAYHALGNSLFEWARIRELEVHDVGPAFGDESFALQLQAERVIIHGRLERGAISHLLADAAFGVVAMSSALLAKSSVFASYCAYGLCPIVVDSVPSRGEFDGLVEGEHYLAGLPGASDCQDASRIRESVWSWYQAHTIRSHTAAVTQFLGSAHP